MSLPPQRIAEIRAQAEAKNRARVNGHARAVDDWQPRQEPPDDVADAHAARRPRESPDERKGHSGQVRIAQRLADTHVSELLHVHGLGWHYWDGQRWAQDDVGAAVRTVVTVIKRALHEAIDDSNKPLLIDARRCESANGVYGVLTIAAALPQFAVTVRDLDADPYLLNVKNGTLDLRTLQLRPHDPRDRITRVTRAAYDPGAPDAAWSQFLHQVLPDDDVREYLQRIIGLSLLGRVSEHVLPIWTGTGANGKSTAYKAILWALGDYGALGEPDLFMRRQGAHPTGEFDLMGRRLVVVSESEKGRRLDESKLKRLSGGDPIKARRMRMDFIQFEPSHLAALITNHLPQVSGDDPATWRRLRVIPFNVVIPADEQDPGLDEALQAEADAVLAWAIQGWQQYCERRLDDPPAVVQATDSYRADSDAVGRFIAEQCHVAEAVKATASQLYEAWERWAVKEGLPPISKKAFGQTLDRRGFMSRQSNGKTWWAGICLVQASSSGCSG